MNILHIAPITFNKSSGLSEVIPKIISHQNNISGTNSALLNVNKVNEEIERDNINQFNFLYFNLNSSNTAQLSKLQSPFNKPDLVVFHSIYDFSYIKLSKDLVEQQIPYVIVPHGALTNEAQKRSKVKKYLANKILFRNFLKQASKMQYLSQGEANNSTFFDNEYYIVGNGIDFSNFKMRPYLKGESLEFNFIGRLDIKHKGLDILLREVNTKKEFYINNKVIFNIYGPDYNNGKKYLIDYIMDNSLENVIKIKGPIYDKEKQEVYKNTDFFVLLSRHEGLPTTILEALSYGIPCIVSQGTNLADDIVNNQCGWKVNLKADNLVQIINFILTNPSKIDYYKHNAIKFVQDNYTWNTVTLNALREYKDI